MNDIKAPFDGLPVNRRRGMPAAATLRGLYGGFQPRVYHRKERRRGRRIESPHVLVKCGCCDERLEISYDETSLWLEINGVDASVEDWRKTLLPLLGFGRDLEGNWQDVRSMDFSKDAPRVIVVP